MPHSVFWLPRQRPARGSSPGFTALVQGADSILQAQDDPQAFAARGELIKVLEALRKAVPEFDNFSYNQLVADVALPAEAVADSLLHSFEQVSTPLIQFFRTRQSFSCLEQMFLCRTPVKESAVASQPFQSPTHFVSHATCRWPS